MNEIVEMIYQWHQGAGFKSIQRSLGFDRHTIRKYITLAQSIGISREVAFPPEMELVEKLKGMVHRGLIRETPVKHLITPYRDWVKELLGHLDMTAKQVWRLFREKTELPVSYWTMKRYLRTEFQFGAAEVTVRIEVEPGSQSQVDFGYAGMMVDHSSGKTRRAWAFIMTLSFSRHRFVRFVFRQDIKSWIDCHIRAFEFFGGAPASVVLDYVPGNIIGVMYPPVLCGLRR